MFMNSIKIGHYQKHEDMLKYLTLIDISLEYFVLIVSSLIWNFTIGI
jgi:TRAP-type C4-dicarboxylate transport system substrate-binding protein